MRSLDAIGGTFPLSVDEFASRGYEAARNPFRNPVKAIMDQCDSVENTPPMLGIFNDIPWHRFRESEAHGWAKAGFLWIINDGEHSQWEGVYGREQNSSLLRLGLLPVQRLPREAVSAHGDALQLGALATMRPYATQYEEAVQYVSAMSFPSGGDATPHNRGAYPVRGGDRGMLYNHDELLRAEQECQGWLQFETAEYLCDPETRDRVLTLIASAGKNRYCAFVGTFDASLRSGNRTDLPNRIREFFRVSAAHGIVAGRPVSPGPGTMPQALEDAMVKAIEEGARLLSPHVTTSDLPFVGAEAIGNAFFRACERCGF